MTSNRMRPQLNEVLGIDIEDIASWTPHDGTVNYWLDLYIGPDGEASDIYNVRVVDAVTLSHESPTAIRATIVVDAENYSFAKVEHAIIKELDSCAGKSWGDCSAALNRWFRWEYEDYGFFNNAGRHLRGTRL